MSSKLNKSKVSELKLISNQKLFFLFMVPLSLQWLIIFPDFVAIESLVFALFIIVLWSFRNKFKKISYCMGIVALAFGGLGMALNHYDITAVFSAGTTAELSHSLGGHHSHLSHQATNEKSFWLIPLFASLKHYLWMILFCVTGCVIICRYNFSHCMNVKNCWLVHFLGMLSMCGGMFLFSQLSHYYSVDSLLEYCLSVVGMASGNLLFYQLFFIMKQKVDG